ncbi:MAG: hypothetical protein ACLTC4_13925 [Hungatella hathewayi]
MEQAATIEHMLDGLFQSFDTVTRSFARTRKFHGHEHARRLEPNVVYSALYEKRRGSATRRSLTSTRRTESASIPREPDASHPAGLLGILKGRLRPTRKR